jgi:DNA invertase Pin-like site-specific DNA recombinase
MPRKIGYARVSTLEQNLDLQVNALRLAGCDPIFTDSGVSGSTSERPAFNQALSDVSKGDTLIIWRLDRMSRSLKHLIEINQQLASKHAYFESLTEKIDTSTAMGEFVFHILGAVAQLEREIIRERTKAGLAAAAERGCYPGRPRKLSTSQILSIAEARSLGESWATLADRYDVHEETLRRCVTSANLV